MPWRFSEIKKADPRLGKLVSQELRRQQMTLDLIPSENIAPLAILEAVGSPLMNKYSEGYPGKRYYPGNEFYDEIEELAQNRALKAFGLDSGEWHVNVQPHSGSPANVAIYSGLMELTCPEQAERGDTLMGMRLSHGGHLTHGHKASFTGKAWKVVQYGVDPITNLIDYGQVRQLALAEKPKVIVSGYTAYPRYVNFEAFGKIAKEVAAYHVADISHIAGLVSAGLHPSPFSHADVVMTTTHKTLRGPRGAVVFCRQELADKIDRAIFPGMQGGPHNNTTAAIALMFHFAMKPGFKKYQQQVVKNAKALAVDLIKYGFNLVSGGTDNHLILIDIRNKGLDGSGAEKILESAGIIANRNSVPGDESPFKPSGIRAGAPAVTARGLKEKEMKLLARWFDRLLTQNEPPAKIRKEVETLCRKYPLPY
jgi:glycine hydroxymethyltransferase